jgi:hypothetical protein
MKLVERAEARIASLAHIHTRAYGQAHIGVFEIMRGDAARAAPHATGLVRLAREHDLNYWRAVGVFLDGWVKSTSGEGFKGLADMRRGVELLREQNIPIMDAIFKMALAGAEARAGDPKRAVAILDDALATCERIGHRALEPNCTGFAAKSC